MIAISYVLVGTEHVFYHFEFPYGSPIPFPGDTVTLQNKKYEVQKRHWSYDTLQQGIRAVTFTHNVVIKVLEL